MKTRGTALSGRLRWIVGPIIFLGFAAGVVVLMLWLAGKFTAKVSSVITSVATGSTEVPTGRIAAASLITVPLSESAIGTIRAVHETAISSRILARVLEVNLKAGQAVQAGQVLVRLDDVDLKARLQQAKAALAAAEAAHAQAKIDDERLGKLVGSGAASRQEYEKVGLAVKSTDAEARRIRESINEVQALLDNATVKSPMDGVVIDKKIDVGDMAMPGQVLVTLYDPKRMQLIASVRESLAYKLQIGQSIGVKIDQLDKVCNASISEIVPEAQSASRAFQVKVTGPCPPGIYTGMFGRILIPLADEQVLVIPRRAVQLVGQLELADVIEAGQISRRAIRTGRPFGNDVEVLSGLRQGEKVVTSAPATTREASNG